MTTVWSFLLVLSLLILVHEFGHFVVARLVGVRVLKFSLGFGPRVFGFVRGGTDYCLSAFPLGGFVKMLGEQPGETIPEEDQAHSFSHRSVGQRAAIVAAGPVFNLLFAWLIFFVILLAYGDPVLLPDIGNVQPDSPAAQAGIVKGDRILSIDGRPIHTWDEISKDIRNSGARKVVLEVSRGGQTLTVVITPKIEKVKNLFGEAVEVPMIGVSSAGTLQVLKLNPVKALSQAFVKTWALIAITFEGIVKLVERVVPLSALGGPIMIAQLAGQQAELGILNLFYFMALLSINLGILNLFPIPVLDGGHLLFNVIEAVRGRPLTQRQMEVAQQIGIFVLGALMLLVFYNDIARLFGFGPSPTGTP